MQLYSKTHAWVFQKCVKARSYC